MSVQNNFVLYASWTDLANHISMPLEAMSPSFSWAASCHPILDVPPTHNFMSIAVHMKL